MTYCNNKGIACELATISGHCSVSACRKVILTPKGSKPMSEQMQKLAARYEKATGKKFGARSKADQFRAKTDEELAEFLSRFVSPLECPVYVSALYKDGMKYADAWMKYLQQPAEEGTV